MPDDMMASGDMNATSGAMEPEHDEMAEPMDKDEGYQSLFIEPTMLPEGMASTMKPGDILEFKYVGTDKDGDIEVVYNTGDKKDEGEDWETGFRAAMSPQSNETPEVPQDNY